MSKINGVTNIDNTNYNIGTQKASTNNTDFESYLGESKSLDQIFEKAAKKYDVPVNLLKAIGKQESNFNPNAVSRCGAQGVMQLMPATAKGLGVTDSFDAEQNIMAGAKYISAKIKKYDGDITLALAAYNAGSGNVAKYGGVPPFKETQHYVKKVMGYYNQGDLKIADKYNNYTTSTKEKSADESRKIYHAAAVNTSTPISTNYAYLLGGDSSLEIDSAEDLASIFSYEDYIRFLDILLHDDEEDSTKKAEQKSNTNYSDINYNPTVLNLLTNQNSE